MVTLTREAVAERLGIPGSTLSRKLNQFNRENPKAQVLPDEIEDHGHYRVHLYHLNTVARVEEAVKAVTKRGQGRPKKGEA